MTLDAVVLILGFFGAYWLRFSTGWFQGPSEALRGEHAATLLLLLPLWILIHGVNGLYRPRVMARRFRR